jgi:hypothetical protein
VEPWLASNSRFAPVRPTAPPGSPGNSTFSAELLEVVLSAARFRPVARNSDENPNKYTCCYREVAEDQSSQRRTGARLGDHSEPPAGHMPEDDRRDPEDRPEATGWYEEDPDNPQGQRCDG